MDLPQRLRDSWRAAPASGVGAVGAGYTFRRRLSNSSTIRSAACSALSAVVSMRISGCFGRLIGAVDAGEIGQLAGPRLGVEALDVAPLGLGQRRVDEDLDELALGQHRADHLALGAERAR